MPAPLNPKSSSVSDDNENSPPAEHSSSSEINGSSPPLSNHHNLDKTPEAYSIDLAVDDLGRGVQDIGLTLKRHTESSDSLLDRHDNSLLKRENSFEDDRTHLSTSSTKMTNFDSKSLASVTTFAMDEKDSVRPDDSASVQAIDEDESLSGLASGAPNSVAGSEADSRVFRDQFRDGIPTRPRGILPISGPLFNGSQPVNGIISPDSVANNFVIPANPDSVQDGQNLHGFPLEPDEKLLEAMKSPKDRLLILQLEEKIRYFIKECTEQSLELPPSNAFGRLLAHKLGDYYHLTHFVDNNVTSVRLHRTPFCRLPTPLSAVHAATNTTPPPIVPAMKIMRRNDGGQFDESVGGSSNPSKANSETGDSGPDGERNGSSSGATPAKDRMALTREEREAKYHQVRERIFRDFPDSAKTEPATGDPNDISRSSSTNGRKKPQKQRTPVDDSFEVRSQFNAYYPGTKYGNGHAPYNAPMNDNPYSNQVPYLVGPGVPPPSSGYMSTGQTGAMYSGQMSMNSAPQYPVAMSPQMPSNGSWQNGNMPQQSPYHGYASMNQPGMMNQPSSNASSPAMSNYAVPNAAPYTQNLNWNSTPYPTNFQQSPQQQRNGPPVHWPNYPQQPMPSNMQPNMGGYPYTPYSGQHMNPAFQNSAAHHSMQPGYPRSHFNPQTRSFVPGGVPLGHHPSKGPQHPTQQYSNMQSGVQPGWNAYPEAVSHRPMDPNPAMIPNRLPTGPRDSIAKWGTPSHLPPKPPPSEVPSEFDLKNRPIPASVPVPPYASNGVANGPLVISGGVALSKQN
jgi:hypothetical protein